MLHLFRVLLENGNTGGHGALQGKLLAKNLKAGDVLRRGDGSTATVQSVELKELEGLEAVYNMEVEDYHTYFVGAGGVLVHNACGMSGGEGGRRGEIEADFVAAPGGVVYTANDYAKIADFERPSTLYHYTTEKGMQGILSSESMYPSIKTPTTKDARMGSGQYLTDIVPGSKTAGQTSKTLFGVPWNTNKVSHYVEIDISDLNVLKGRDGVYYVPGDTNLDLTNRIVGFGKVGG